MGDHLKKVQSGDPLKIPASTYNAFIDAAGKAKEGQHDLAGTAGRQLPDQDIVLVQNTSGADVDRFGVLALNGPIITPTDNPDEFQSRPMFEGVTPTDTHRGWFVVLLEPVPAGGIGRGCLAGITVAKVDVIDATHAAADVKVGDVASLESCDDGAAVILWAESGTGVKWAVVRLGRDSPWHCGMIIMWSGTVANIPDGWALCDGGYYCIRHGIKDHGCGSGYTTVNLSARMVMCIAVGGQAGENAIGDTGGYRVHGASEPDNNHDGHDTHYLNAHSASGIDPHTDGDIVATVDGHSTSAIAVTLDPHDDYDVAAAVATHGLHTHEIALEWESGNAEIDDNAGGAGDWHNYGTAATQLPGGPDTTHMGSGTDLGHTGAGAVQ